MKFVQYIFIYTIHLSKFATKIIFNYLKNLFHCILSCLVTNNLSFRCYKEVNNSKSTNHFPQLQKMQYLLISSRRRTYD